MRNLALLGFLLLVGCDQPSDTAVENTPKITATTTRMASWPAEKFFSIVEGAPECGSGESPYYWRADVAFTETKLRERSEEDPATDLPLDELFLPQQPGGKLA